ncbi:MAG: hypothetical protein GPOALKHO_000486 [Sodalis sp.]|nr:MAG: hypothetical protein GPOALKHO_000486 [Sodalis sp.]
MLTSMAYRVLNGIWIDLSQLLTRFLLTLHEVFVNHLTFYSLLNSW